ncbi:DUF6786 family protein [Bacteroidota bacterium]
MKYTDQIKRICTFFSCLLLILVIYSCNQGKKKHAKGSFGYDVEFLQQYTEAFTLKSPSGSGKILIVPEYQGRIMTSSLAGDVGNSFGWVNYDLISSGKQLERFNPYGGEDRFWLGPEGGQFSLYHKKGGPFEMDNWYVPEQVDKLSYELVKRDESSADFTVEFDIINYSGTIFYLKLERSVRVYNEEETSNKLGIWISENVGMVGFESNNVLFNMGDEKWDKESGLISIWILGLYIPGDETVICIPYQEGNESDLGPVMNDTYFGKVPADRLKAIDGAIYFSADGKYRSKIGLNWHRCKNILGSYDPVKNVLTIVQFNKPEEPGEYMKAMWEIMQDPYNGDAVNSYNDGVTEPGGKPLGPFYELETSSSVKELNPGESIQHIHRTFHFQGEKKDLNTISRELLGVSLDEIQSAL